MALLVLLLALHLRPALGVSQAFFTTDATPPSTIIISTVAGTGSTSYNGDNITATSASLNGPYGVALDSYGDLYISENYNNRVRRVALSSGIITTYAGTGSGSYSGDGGQATAAGINWPHGVAFDSSNNMYIAEYGSHRVRRVDYSSRVITTVAGDGNQGSGGDGGAATSASLNYPVGVLVDSSGSYLYIADRSNNKIRRVSLSTSIITVYAGTGSTSSGGDNGPATSAGIYLPHQMTLDGDGNMYVAELYGHRIRRIAASANNIITTVAGTGSAGYGGDGGPATSADLNTPPGVHINRLDGLLYIGDLGNYRLRRVSSDGIISTVAGTGSYGYSGESVPATSASLGNICEIASSSNGDLYFAEREGSLRVRKLSMGYGTPSAVPTRTPTAQPSYDPSTIIISTVAGTGSTSYNGDNITATSASLNWPYGVALDSYGGAAAVPSSSPRQTSRRLGRLRTRGLRSSFTDKVAFFENSAFIQRRISLYAAAAAPFSEPSSEGGVGSSSAALAVASEQIPILREQARRTRSTVDSLQL